MSFHDVYHQSGGGGRGVTAVYVGSPRMRGHGLGSWFSGIFRSALPYLTRGARAIGKKALRAGANILEDVGDSNMTFNKSFQNRLNESGHNLKRKATEKMRKLMDGSGYNQPPRKRSRQSRLVLVPRKTTSGNKKRKRTRAKKRSTTKKNKTRKRESKSVNSARKTKRANIRRKKSKKSKLLDIFDKS